MKEDPEIVKELKIAENLPILEIDQKRIQQVIIKLLNNAIKNSTNNSSINIRVKREEDTILFEIQDFGKGIPKDKQKKIFEIFYQVDSGMDRKFGGAGLGLAIAQGIVLAHDGKIWVESTLGEGSTFKFTLPVKSFKDVNEGSKDNVRI